MAGMQANIMMPNMMPPHMMAQYGAMPPMMGPMGHMPHQYMGGGMPMMPPPHGMMGAPPRPLFPAAASSVGQQTMAPSQPKPTFPAYRLVLTFKK